MTGPVSTKSEKEKSVEQSGDHSSEVAQRPTPSGTYADILRLQRIAGNQAVSDIIQHTDRTTETLDNGIQSAVEAQLGADLSDVRLHTGPGAEGLARAEGAAAFTSGRDVYLGQGFNPSSDIGQRVIAHELTHVVQQERGKAGQPLSSKAVLEGEARAVSGVGTAARTREAGAALPGSVQRITKAELEAQLKEEWRRLHPPREGAFRSLNPDDVEIEGGPAERAAYKVWRKEKLYQLGEESTAKVRPWTKLSPASAKRETNTAPQPIRGLAEDAGQLEAQAKVSTPEAKRQPASPVPIAELTRDIERIKDELNSFVYMFYSTGIAEGIISDGIEERVIGILNHWAERTTLGRSYLDLIFDGLQTHRSRPFPDTTYYDAMLDDFKRANEIRRLRDSTSRYRGRISTKEAQESQQRDEEKAQRDKADVEADLYGGWTENFTEEDYLPSSPENSFHVKIEFQRLMATPDEQLLPHERLAREWIFKEGKKALLRKIHFVTASERSERRKEQLRSFAQPIVEILLWETGFRMAGALVEAVVARLFAADVEAATTVTAAAERKATESTLTWSEGRVAAAREQRMLIVRKGYSYQIKSINPVSGEVEAVGFDLYTRDFVKVEINIDTQIGVATRGSGEALPIRGGRVDLTAPRSGVGEAATKAGAPVEAPRALTAEAPLRATGPTEDMLAKPHQVVKEVEPGSVKTVKGETAVTPAAPKTEAMSSEGALAKPTHVESIPELQGMEGSKASYEADEVLWEGIAGQYDAEAQTYRSQGRLQEAQSAEKSATEARLEAAKLREEPSITKGEATPPHIETPQSSAIEGLTETQLQRRMELTAKRKNLFAKRQEIAGPLKKAKLEFEQADQAYRDIHNEFTSLNKEVRPGDPRVAKFNAKQTKIVKNVNAAESKYNGLWRENEQLANEIEGIKWELEDLANFEKGLSEGTSRAKGIFGHFKADEYMKSEGYTLIGGHDPRIPSQGIDGVYMKHGPPKEYVVMEAKYGKKGKLAMTDDGEQMSTEWIHKRLDEAVNDRNLANEIRKKHKRWLLRYDVEKRQILPPEELP